MNDRLAPAARRRGLKLGLVNAAIYSMGYALTTGAIVTYLAIDLGANGKALSLLLATPSLAGLLRLFSPTIIARVGSTKRTCIAALACGFMVLSGLPMIGWLAPQMPRDAADLRGLHLSIARLHWLCGNVGLVCRAGAAKSSW